MQVVSAADEVVHVVVDVKVDVVVVVIFSTVNVVKERLLVAIRNRSLSLLGATSDVAYTTAKTNRQTISKRIFLNEMIVDWMASTENWH